jgi:hypothetical protein
VGVLISRSDIYLAVDAERERQAERWAAPHPWGVGDCSSPDVPDTVKAAVLMEETGEVARALLDADRRQLRNELVQVAAVAVAWLEGLTP